MPDQPDQFRAALHGYNREDVVAFIDRMTREHEDAVRRLEEKNERLRNDLAQANEALAEAQENAETKKALDEAQETIFDLNSRNSELEERIRSLEDALEQARRRSE